MSGNEQIEKLARSLGLPAAALSELVRLSAEESARRERALRARIGIGALLVLVSLGGGAVYAGVPTLVWQAIAGPTSPPLPGEAVPRQIVYRGFLEKDGVPHSSAGAPVPMTFRFYGADGGVLYSENKDVPVLNGHFSVELLDAADAGIGTLSQPFVELGVGVEGAELGRQRLLSVPFARRSGDVPAGTIVAYGGSTPPPGWLLCDGSERSRANFRALFDALGTTYGVGDGVSTFNLPDLRGIFVKGAGATTRAAGRAGNGAYYAGTLGTYSQDGFQGHWHAVNDPGHVHNLRGDWDNGWGGGTFYGGSQAFTSDTAQSNTTGVTVRGPVTDGTNGAPRGSSTTEPASLGLNYVIKY